MGKESKPRVGELANLLKDSDPLVVATALDVLAGLGSTASAAIPKIKEFRDKIDQHEGFNKDQREYFKKAADFTIDKINGVPAPKK